MKSTADKKSIGLGQRLRWRLRRRLVWVPVWGWIVIALVIGVARPEIEPRLRRSVTTRGPVALFLASSGDDAVFDGDEPAAESAMERARSGDPDLFGPVLFHFVPDASVWPDAKWGFVETRMTRVELEAVSASQGVSQPTWRHARELFDRFEVAFDRHEKQRDRVGGWGRRHPSPSDPDYLVTAWTYVSRRVLWGNMRATGTLAVCGGMLVTAAWCMVVPGRAERREARWRRGECPACRFPRPVGAGRCPECGDGWAEEEVPLQAVGRRR